MLSQTMGIIPRLGPQPSIEQDLPEPVCPYANKQQLQPCLFYDGNVPCIDKYIGSDLAVDFLLISILAIDGVINPISVHCKLIMRPERIIEYECFWLAAIWGSKVRGRSCHLYATFAVQLLLSLIERSYSHTDFYAHFIMLGFFIMQAVVLYF